MLAECGGCGTRFAWDLLRCPHCGSEERAGEMPKITAEGVSFPVPEPGDVPEGAESAAEAPEAPAAEPEVPADAPAAPAPAAPSLPPSAPPLRVPPEPPGE